MNKEEISNLICNINNDFNNFDINLIDILDKYSELRPLKEENTCISNKPSKLIYKRKFTSDLSTIKKYNNLINTLNDLKNATKFLELDLNICRPFFKLIYDKYDFPVLFITKLSTNEIGEVFSFKIYGFYGEATRTNDIYNKFNYIELSGINRSIFNMLDISTIEVNRYFRQGRGSAIIKYLENELIEGFNNSFINKNNPLLRIEGTIGALGGHHVSTEDRIRFYIKNGFTVVGRRFYKNISTIGFFDNII